LPIFINCLFSFASWVLVFILGWPCVFLENGFWQILEKHVQILMRRGARNYEEGRCLLSLVCRRKARSANRVWQAGCLLSLVCRRKARLANRVWQAEVSGAPLGVLRRGQGFVATPSGSGVGALERGGFDASAAENLDWWRARWSPRDWRAARISRGGSTRRIKNRSSARCVATKPGLRSNAQWLCGWCDGV
jgi:hypothetical protein